MEQIIVVDHSSKTIQFNFMDINKFKKQSSKYNLKNLIDSICEIVIICSIILFLILSALKTWEKISLTAFVISSVAFVINPSKGNIEISNCTNDIIKLYDYIYKNDFRNINVQISEDNFLCLDHSQYSNTDFPMTFKINQLTTDNIDVDYIIDLGMFKDTYYCNVIQKG